MLGLLDQFSSADELSKFALYEQLLLSNIEKMGKKSPYSLNQLLAKPEMCSREINSAIYSATEKSDEFYVNWLNKMLKRANYPHSLPTDLAQIRDPYFYVVIMSFTYPELMKANPVAGVSHEQMLEKLSEICTNNSIAWWPKLQYIAAGYRDAIKAVLR